MAQWRAVIDIPATSRGPAAARRVVAALLPVWGLPVLVDDAQLVISELVTNAVNHSPGTDSLELELVRRARGVRLALADGSTIRPIIRELDHASTSGRGMRIVEQLAADWGAESHHGGKRVWVDLDVVDGPDLATSADGEPAGA